jgi:hypothetical protein
MANCRLEDFQFYWHLSASVHLSGKFSGISGTCFCACIVFPQSATAVAVKMAVNSFKLIHRGTTRHLADHTSVPEGAELRADGEAKIGIGIQREITDPYQQPHHRQSDRDRGVGL